MHNLHRATQRKSMKTLSPAGHLKRIFVVDKRKHSCILTKCVGLSYKFDIGRSRVKP